MWIVRVKIGWKPKQIDFKLDEDKDEDKINMYKTVNVDGKMILGWILNAFFRRLFAFRRPRERCWWRSAPPAPRASTLLYPAAACSGWWCPEKNKSRQ